VNLKAKQLEIIKVKLSRFLLGEEGIIYKNSYD
jgi:hypothetical protein